MQALNLPTYDFSFTKKNGKICILDEIRKKYLVLTPEEWVRQNFIKYLISEKGYSPSLLSQEYSCQVGNTKKRCDIAVFNRHGEIKAIVECKAPEVHITRDVFDQIQRYELAISSGVLIVTNGIQHYCCVKNQGDWNFVEDIPSYETLG